MGKKITTNPKSVEAKARKEEKKKAENEMKEKAKQDAFWKDDDKLINRKINRKEEKYKKKQEEISKKQINKKLYEEEMQSLKSAKPKPTKVTRAQIEITIEKSKTIVEPIPKLDSPIEDNPNLIESEVTAATIDEAISVLSHEEKVAIDKHPEKRMKAAYNAYEEINLPILKEENPNLRLSQLKQLLYKNWLKSPENPMNQLFKI